MLSPIDSEGNGSTSGGAASAATDARHPRLSIEAADSDDAAAAAAGLNIPPPAKSRSRSRSRTHNVVIAPRTVSRQHDAPASDALMRKLRRSASLARKKSATQVPQQPATHGHLPNEVVPPGEPPIDTVDVPVATAEDSD
ncbi:hypothetical protein HK405_005763, partial [Cladochytrium tenue]